MYYAPKHSTKNKRHPMRSRIVGAGIVVASTFATGVSLSPPAQAAVSVWDVVAACESGGNWAINTRNGYYGGLQFSWTTWKLFGGTRYAPTANRASKTAQIRIARRALAAQGPGAWPVCGRRARLTKANGGAAAQLTTVSRSRVRSDVSARGTLAVDGVMGQRTIRAIQRWVGAPQTGNLGPITRKALQRRVGVRADGVLGTRTIRTLQSRIGARRDGARRLNPATVAALQRYLNRY